LGHRYLRFGKVAADLKLSNINKTRYCDMRLEYSSSKELPLCQGTAIYSEDSDFRPFHNGLQHIRGRSRRWRSRFI